MTIHLSRILAQIIDTPMMIHPGKAKAILAGLGGRIVDGGFNLDFDGVEAVDHWPSLKSGKLTDQIGREYDRAGRSPFAVVDNVAVIPVEGTLVHKGSYVGQSSGQTSYEGLQAQVMRAGRDDRIKGIVYEFDTFGGLVAGLAETAEMMRRVSQAKPTIAILTDFALSAGYYLASQQRQIVIPPQGMAGSIGTIMVHTDLSKRLENEGIKLTVLTSGARKADGHPAEPLADDTRDRLLAMMDRARESFAAAVGRGRGKRLTAQAALATEAETFDDESALKAGLVDAVGFPNDAFAAFVAAVNRAR